MKHVDTGKVKSTQTANNIKGEVVIMKHEYTYFK